MTLYSQVIRLAHANPELRPHLLQVLAGLDPLVVKRVFDDTFVLRSRFTAPKVLRWDRSAVETEDGEDVTVRYPSQVQCTLLTDTRYEIDEAELREHLTRAAEGAFTQSLYGKSDFREYLNVMVEAGDSEVRGGMWDIERVTVRDITVARPTITITFVIDLKADFRHAKVTHDTFHTHYASLRGAVIRLAHEFPEFQKDLLPLVVK